MTDSYRQLQTVRDPLQGQPGTWDGDTKLLSGFSPETQMMTESGGGGVVGVVWWGPNTHISVTSRQFGQINGWLSKTSKPINITR